MAEYIFRMDGALYNKETGEAVMKPEVVVEILSELRSWFSCFDEKEGLAYHALSLAIRAIKANHTERPERKKGRWNQIISTPNDMYGRYYCSECGKEGNPVWYFCPNCGADMRGDSE